jgi:hypothetical protein
MECGAPGLDWIPRDESSLQEKPGLADFLILLPGLPAVVAARFGASFLVPFVARRRFFPVVCFGESLLFPLATWDTAAGPFSPVCCAPPAISYCLWGSFGLCGGSLERSGLFLFFGEISFGCSMEVCRRREDKGWEADIIGKMCADWKKSIIISTLHPLHALRARIHLLLRKTLSHHRASPDVTQTPSEREREPIDSFQKPSTLQSTAVVHVRSRPQWTAVAADTCCYVPPRLAATAAESYLPLVMAR